MNHKEIKCPLQWWGGGGSMKPCFLLLIVLDYQILGIIGLQMEIEKIFFFKWSYL
jgi:hypothetical protein